MTADIELLPLPEPMRVLGTRGKDAAEAWFRANVAHATAAKGDEIERLRAELREAWSAVDSKAGWEWKKRAEQAEARANRLAAALRESLEVVQGVLQEVYHRAGQECCGRGSIHGCCGEPEAVWTPEDQAVMGKLAPIERLLNAALRDHDQEGKDG